MGVGRWAGASALAALMAGVATGALAAQAAAPSTAVAPIVVSSTPLSQKDAVLSDIKPELQFTPEDIQSFGVSNVSELLDEIAPQTSSDRGRGGEGPVVLLNGREISGMGEIRDIPAEAILRVDVLPEEVALKFGYPANQKVINIVLKPDFRAVTVEAEGGGSTEGGHASGQGNVSQFSVHGDNRVNLSLRYTAASALTEDERDLISRTGTPFSVAGNVTGVGGGEIDPALSALAGRTVTVAGIPTAAGARPLTLSDYLATAGTVNADDAGRYRTLSPATQQVTANAVVARALGHSIAATFNASLGANTSRALQGLPEVSFAVPAGDPFSPFATPVVADRYATAFGPLRQNTDGWTAHLGGNIRADLGDWRGTVTANYDHGDSRTTTGTGADLAGLQGLLDGRSASFNPFGPLPSSLVLLPNAKARSLTDTANARVLLRGELLKLPAGEVSTSLRLGDSQSWIDTRSQRLGVVRSVTLSRNDLGAQVNLDVPIASRKAHVLSALGELSVNGNAAFDRVSDFGTLSNVGFGASWTPLTGLQLVASRSSEQGAPSVSQLGGPILLTPGSRIFDYATGRTVDVVQVSGGNPDLRADRREVLKLGANIKPWTALNLTLTASYTSSRTHNPVQTFPAATAEIQAAFPDRFERDETGQLVRVDYRPVNFALEDRQELRWGFNFIQRLGNAAPPQRPQGGRAAVGRALQGQGQGQGGQGQARGGRGQGFGAGGGRGGQAQGQGQGAAQLGRLLGRGAPGGPPDGGPPDGAAPPPPDGGGGPPPGAPDGGGPPPGGGPGGFGPGGDGRGGFGGGGFAGGGPGGFGGGGGGFGGGGFGGGRGGVGRGGGGPGTQVQFAVYHTVMFVDRILVRPGGPVLDLLNGSAAGGGGGQPRHQIEAQAGYSTPEIGLRLNATWRSPTFVRGQGTATGDLRFSSLTTLNLRLFANLGAIKGIGVGRPWMQNARLTLSVTNLLNQRTRVRDASGATPLSYQPAYLDPLGRVVRLTLRKQFT